MDDLISRQAAIDAICKACANSDDYVECIERRPESTFCDEIVALRKLPSAQPEQRTGTWLVAETHSNWGDFDTFICTNCDAKFEKFEATKFCPNCGARMVDCINVRILEES